ncbi:hypothetical protein ACFQ0X_44035 [Streptomyces rectiviolaceus]|uniref:Uncharacterized protein n=1 Tax=Streptomyces rectiviolaceus TaxID=332591 RepID=A0ABP6NPQ7_9ACTN
MGRDETATARLRELNAHFREHPRTGPAERHAPTVTSSAPLNIGILDHMKACVDEVVQHARATDPATGPAPAKVTSLYDWFREHTAHAGDEQQRVRETVIYRQGLEHAILQGDTDVVCTHPCPGCRTWGLQWDRARRRALCLNMDCQDRSGGGSTWSLGRIATQHITAQESLRRRAT